MAGQDFQIPDHELRFQFARASGAGGQNVNKVNSKAILTWNVWATVTLSAEAKQRFYGRHHQRISEEGDFVMVSQKFRDQPRNIQDCIEKLTELIAAARVRPKVRRATKPSAGGVRRRLEAKKRQGKKKELRKSRPGQDRE